MRRENEATEKVQATRREKVENVLKFLLGAAAIVGGSQLLVDGGSAEEPVVTRTVYPTYRGALVVCQGGDQADVKLAVTEAVAALTGLSADRITVAKSQ